MPDSPSGAAADPFYISATGSPLEQRTRVLKHDDTFAIFDPTGDIPGGRRNAGGLFHRDTRYLSLVELRIDGERPLLLSSAIGDDNVLLTCDLTNPDIRRDDAIVLPKDLLHLTRAKYLWNGACHERLTLDSYADAPVTVTVEWRFAADFADLFEVRGHRRSRRGTLSAKRGPAHVELRYAGLDGVTRRTLVSFDPAPQALDGSAARFTLEIRPAQRLSLFMTVGCDTAPEAEPRYFIGMRAAQLQRRRAVAGTPGIVTSDSRFDDMMTRAKADIAMLVTDTPHGPYPYAGIPWFSAPFGRDALVTALETLWLEPRLAQGVLHYLAAHQATTVDPAADAEPGKILHERRFGELAELGEIPFKHYYGSIDSTPLFVLLAGAYHARTGDLVTLRALWPALVAAIDWIDRHGDRDGDGFVEYARMTEAGLANQGWKDSHDSIFHADGRDAPAPIALCEVQAYVYAAKRGGAVIARALGESGRAATWDAAAETLRGRFEDSFWCEELGTYALALDGDKQPCRVRSSNAGHALLTGIASPERAARVAETLCGRDSFSGWGIRTIATGEARYNPMSYHNGSVWPHDNALIALGLARYGHTRLAARLLTSLFEAGLTMEQRRLPELFCGFSRRPRQTPTLYPVACSPQAWASAAPAALLQACLGLELDLEADEIRFRRPELPGFLDEVALTGLTLGASRVDVVLRGRGADVGVSVPRRSGTARVVTIS